MRILLFLACAASLLAQAQYDLLLKGGHVIDPKNNISARRDVAIKDGKVAAVAANIPATSAGKTVDVGFWSNPQLKLKGTVREVAGSADPASRTFAVRISLPSDPGVLLGMTASVKTEAGNDRPLFSLPLSALARDPANRAIVWTVNPAEQTVHERPVTVVDFSDTGVRVSEGLKAGDLVVVAGTQFMVEDLKVKLADPEQAALANTTQSSQTR